MVATFTDFDSTMAHTVVVDTGQNTVDVTFFNRAGNAGNTYRYSLSNAEVNDIISICVARSKGQLLHQMLDIRKGVRLDSGSVKNVTVPVVTPKVKRQLHTPQRTDYKISSLKTQQRQVKSGF